MKSYLRQCVTVCTLMVHLVIVVNAAPLPSHVDWQRHREDSLSSADADGESDNDGYDMSRFLGTTPPTAGSTNIAPTESITIIKPSSTSAKSDAAQDRGKKKDSSATELKKLLGSISNDMELPQCPWNQNEEWSDQVLRDVMTYIYHWRKNVEPSHNNVPESRRLEAPPPPRQALPDVKTRIAQLNEMDRSQLNSEMDVLWKWVVQRRAFLAHKQVLSAQSKLSELNAESKSHIPDDELVRLLLQSVDRTIDRAKMPWRVAKDTFQWDPSHNDVKKVLSYIWRTKGKSNKTKLEHIQKKEELLFNGPPSDLLKEMDEAWKWWINKQKGKGEERRKANSKAVQSWRRLQ